MFQNYVTAKNHKHIWLQICESRIDAYSDLDGMVEHSQADQVSMKSFLLLPHTGAFNTLII
jgi:hypothetical protein